METWVDIPGYEGFYMASSLGNIKSVGRVLSNQYKKFFYDGKIMKPKFDSHGYLCVKLCRNGEQTSYLVSRLIAKCFLPNPENKKTVNHKNGVKTDNRVENLEWATHSENVKHSYAILNRAILHDNTPSRVVHQYDLGGKFMNSFKNIATASRNTGIPTHVIGPCANGKHKTGGGFVWTFKEELRLF